MYRTVLVQAVGLGLFSGVFGIGYLLGVDWLTDALWGEDWSSGGFLSGSVWTVLIPVVAGLVGGSGV